MHVLCFQYFSQNLHQVFIMTDFTEVIFRSCAPNMKLHFLCEHDKVLLTPIYILFYPKDKIKSIYFLEKKKNHPFSLISILTFLVMRRLFCLPSILFAEPGNGPDQKYF